jgi:hypothetical protein
VDAKALADRALVVVNDTIVAHKDIQLPPLLTATVSSSSALVFVVGNRSHAVDYEPYLSILRHALQQDGFATIAAVVSERWTRFTLNGVPTTVTMDQIRYQIAMMYPELRMGRDPRWLTTDAKRAGKEASAGGPHKATDRGCPKYCALIARSKQTGEMDLA